MIFLNYLLVMILPVFFTGRITHLSGSDKVMTQVQEKPVYNVSKLKGAITIDANWNKAQWENVQPVDVTHYMGKISAFQPRVQAKMIYDESNVYVIFKVEDRFVKSIVTEYNGPVSTDSCVEFFFSPDTEAPLNYFNLEVNAGGTPLMFYIVKAMPDYKKLEPSELKQIEIAHSLPEKIDPEITDPVTWTIEYRIPLSVLEKYSKVSKPAPGVKWKANFYKTGSDTSNPNYITWSVVDFPRPNFHLPQFFGTLIFQ